MRATDPTPAPVPIDDGFVMPDPEGFAPSHRQIDVGGGTLRQHAARGTLINGAFLVSLYLVTALRGFVLAGLLSTRDFGVWGVLVVTLGTVLWLKQAGIGDKYIQQDEPDQELAFQKAFTLEAIFTSGFAAVLIAVVVVMTVAYGRPQLLAPGLALIGLLPAAVLQTPLWVYERSMRFGRQRMLQAADPVVGFVVAIGLALAGAGYWSLVIGTLAGAWAAALLAVATTPYKLRWRYERGTARAYASFSWPLVVAGGSSMVIAQGAVIFTTARLGLAAVGALSLAASISSLSDNVDSIVSGTLYPAICAVRDRTELLFETFVKSNRLSLIWAVPFGVGVALFAHDLIRFGIGQKWEPAAPLLIVFGLTAALNHVGFNWDSYLRAQGRTRPLAVAHVATMVAFLVSGIPLLYADGLRGLAIGIAVSTVVSLLTRSWYLTRMFDGLKMARHTARAIAPSVPAVAAVLVARLLEHGPRTAVQAVAELVAYTLITIAATIGFERRLLTEVLAYLAPGLASRLA